jgi:CRISPR-associated endonuclease/helicase Cas3
MLHYAHSVAGKPTEHWQSLADHLIGVAKLAEFRAEKFGAGRAAYIAGALHDVGKYTESFQRRLYGGEKVDHAIAGAALILSLAGRPDLHMADLIAHAIAGHHGGMPDRRGGEHSTLDIRLEKPLPALVEVWHDEVGPLPTSESRHGRHRRAGAARGIDRETGAPSGRDPLRT